MLFNSYIFLFAFLPVTWLVYFGMNRIGREKTAQALLILASFLFYGYDNWKLCPLLAVSIGENYAIHALLLKQGMKAFGKKLLLICGLTVNFSLLFYFKYLDFAISNINAVTGADIALRHIALPLGISFYTFQQVSFVIDSYRGHMPRYAFWDYALFVSFFPQLVAGPIVLHQEMIPQFQDKNRKRINYGNLIAGLEYLIWGLAKKAILADTFGKVCDAGFAVFSNLNGLSEIAVMLSYTLEIYFDFSGYCDMAIGLGKLFNIDIPVNFKSPYKARNISDFWKRWHITLTRFLTTYLYIPLGGSRKGKWRTYLNVMIVFTLSGLWHGANWNFVIWGMLHGAALVFYRMFRKYIDKMPAWATGALTFAFVNITWLFFNTENLKAPLIMVYRMFMAGGGGFYEGLTAALCDKSIPVQLLLRFRGVDLNGWLQPAMLTAWLVGGTGICILAPSTHEIIEKRCRKNAYFLWLALLFVWSVIRLSEVAKFIYFNF